VLDQEKVVNVRYNRQLRESTQRLADVLASNAVLARTEDSLLREKLQKDQGVLSDEMKLWGSQLTQALDRCSQLDEHRQLAEKAKAQALERDIAELAGRLEASQAVANASLKPQIARLKDRITTSERSCEELHSRVQLSAANSGHVLLAISAVLPDGLPESSRRLLLSLGTATEESSVEMLSTMLQSGDGIADLEEELRRSAGVLASEAAAEELRRIDAETSQSSTALDSKDSETHLEAVGLLSTAQSNAALLEHKLKELECRSLADDGASALLHSEEQLRLLNKRIIEAEAFLQRTRTRAESAKANLQIKAQAAKDDASTKARLPLKQEVTEASAELERLRLRLPVDLKRRMAAMQEQFAQHEQRDTSEQHSMEAELRKELEAVCLEISSVTAAQVASAAAKDAAGARLRGELTQVLKDLELASAELGQLREQLQSAEEGARRQRDALWRTQRRLSEAAEVSRQDIRNAEDSELELSRQHSDLASKLRQESEELVASMKTSAMRSINSLSNELCIEGEDLLREHTELEAKALRLAARARAQLGTDGGA